MSQDGRRGRGQPSRSEPVLQMGQTVAWCGGGMHVVQLQGRVIGIDEAGAGAKTCYAHLCGTMCDASAQRAAGEVRGGQLERNACKAVSVGCVLSPFMSKLRRPRDKNAQVQVKAKTCMLNRARLYIQL